MYRYFKKIIGVGSTDFGTKTRVEFNGSCLRQDKITYTHGKIIKI